ncbi:MAG: enoyl-CoA hydratase-related protein [Candidatus Nanopelagicales bacterium]
MSQWTHETDGPVLRMSFCDPDSRNRLTTPMLEEGRALLTKAVLDGVRVVILRAEPVKGIWSSGHDISEIPLEAEEHVWANPLENFLEYYRRLPVATIAEVGGNVWGGACELVLSSDLVVAGADVRMAITPAKLGVGYPASGVARFLACLPAQTVARMFLTAEPITMREAHGLGAVTEIVDDLAELPAAARTWADKIIGNAPLTIAATKAALAELSDAHLPPEARHRVDETVARAWTSKDLAEGVRAFTERRSPEFRGH